ncbi:helix-turn-helix domain-containing protein [Spirillospora sp. NBC_00431]
MSFGELLLSLMREQDVSFRELARKAHCNHSYLSKLSRNEHTPSERIAQNLDRALNANGRLAALAPDEPKKRPKALSDLLPNLEEWEQTSELLRRTFLKRGLSAIALPAVGLDELRHIAAALQNARRYADAEVVSYFRRQLDDCAKRDQVYGPKQSIPISLGLVAAIEEIAAEAKTDVRRSLFQVGAQVAEFIGWLYRDATMPDLANYWRDRAVEWAQASRDLPMQGYVLLKKSQAAWDDRNAVRMLTLAEACQDGPWELPLRVQAEAVQQEARGRAMLNDDPSLIEPRLKRARELLAQDRETTGLAQHYNEATFELQIAICYCEAGDVERACEMYSKWLLPKFFSRRDYGYFLALKSNVDLKMNAPSRAASTALEALAVARETNSARTHQEVLRLAQELRPWREDGKVRELYFSIIS